MMNRFAYFEPATLAEAVSLLSQYDTAVAFAGGTDLLVEIKEKIRAPGYVVNIKRIPGLNHLNFDSENGLKFGALVTAREIETSPIIQEYYPGLYQAVRELGSIQVRNRATVAGNICRASPSADTPPPLIAAGATLRLFGPAGERELLLESFFTGPGKTLLRRDEIVTEISVPPPWPSSGQVYIKHGRRKAMELATVGVAVNLALKGGVVRDVKIVLGAVAPTPIRVPAAEKVLQGQTPSDELINTAAEAAAETSRPISDVRSSAAYRREMVGVLTRRALSEAIIRAKS